METKTIKCPKCHGILQVTNPKGEPVLLITCPNPECGAKLRVTFATGDTILADSDKRDDVIGHLTYAGDVYQLEEGVNTIGREAKSSSADIQIETDDRSMSRLHAQIEVKRLKNGRIKAILSDLRDPQKIEQLPTLIEDEPLCPEDAFVLAHGDVLTIGRTKIKYVKS